MDKFVKVCDNLYFGAYPDKHTLEQVLAQGCNLFVDLTNNEDGCPKYVLPSDCERIHYPTPDRRTLSDDKLLLLYKDIVDRDKSTYIHCRGGHGRSAVVAACVYGLRYHKDPEQSLSHIHRVHQERKVIDPKWLKIGAPQTRVQKDQVRRILKIEIKNTKYGETNDPGGDTSPGIKDLVQIQERRRIGL